MGPGNLRRSKGTKIAVVTGRNSNCFYISLKIENQEQDCYQTGLRVDNFFPFGNLESESNFPLS